MYQLSLLTLFRDLGAVSFAQALISDVPSYLHEDHVPNT